MRVAQPTCVDTARTMNARGQLRDYIRRSAVVAENHDVAVDGVNGSVV